MIFRIALTGAICLLINSNSLLGMEQDYKKKNYEKIYEDENGVLLWLSRSGANVKKILKQSSSKDTIEIPREIERFFNGEEKAEKKYTALEILKALWQISYSITMSIKDGQRELTMKFLNDEEESESVTTSGPFAETMLALRVGTVRLPKSSRIFIAPDRAGNTWSVLAVNYLYPRNFCAGPLDSTNKTHAFCSGSVAFLKALGLSTNLFDGIFKNQSYSPGNRCLGCSYFPSISAGYFEKSVNGELSSFKMNDPYTIPLN